MIIYTPSDWYWRADDGRLFSSRSMGLVIEEDERHVAWAEQGGIPTVWPRDENGAQTQAALDQVLSLSTQAGSAHDVSSMQAKIALSRAGILERVQDAVRASPDPEVQIWFTDARTWSRSNAHIAKIGSDLGLSSADIDDLFQAAARVTG